MRLEVRRKPVSDTGALSAAMLISDQLSIYRWEDFFNRKRESQSLALNDATWRANYGNLAERYNRLVAMYNRLLADATKACDASERTITSQSLQIAELRASNDALWEDKQKLLKEKERVQSEPEMDEILANIRRVIREDQAQNGL